MPLRVPGDAWVEAVAPRRLGPTMTEEEAYLEHRSALDATLFRRSASRVTFELDAGTLILVEDSQDDAA